MWKKKLIKSNNIDDEKYKIGIDKIIKDLISISDEEFGYYAFYHDPLERKFDKDAKLKYIKKAIECGKNEAYEIKEKYKTSDLEEIAKLLDVKINKSSNSMGLGYFIFAQYTEPDEITIFMDCVEKANSIILDNKLNNIIKDDAIYKLLLAHELFHKIEFIKSDTIYTKTEKIELWRKPFSNKSKIICLSEISAMSFAKTMLEINYSPYIMNVLLIYGYNKEVSIDLYNEILELSKI